MQSAVRGYVWREKFYGTVVTGADRLHIEPLLAAGPVRSTTTTTGRTVNAYVYRVFSRLRDTQVGHGWSSINKISGTLCTVFIFNP